MFGCTVLFCTLFRVRMGVQIVFGTDSELQHMPVVLSAILSCDLVMHSKLLSTSATPSTLHDDPHQFS